MLNMMSDMTYGKDEDMLHFISIISLSMRRNSRIKTKKYNAINLNAT